MKKIPHRKFIKIYKENNFIDSKLVNINEEYGFVIDMKYPKLGMKKAIKECLVREEVLDKLLEAKNNLPGGYTFKICDAYRPLSLQKEIYNKYKDRLVEEFSLDKLSDEDKEEFIKHYISIPEEDENIPPLHATGGAIDLTIVDLKTGKELDMGVDFDTFSNIATTDYFEQDGMNEEIRNNRRILYNAMIKAGFTNLPSEVWHYDYGNRAWAYYNKKPAIYKGILELK